MISLPRLLPALLIFPLAAHGTVVTTTTDEDDGSLGGGTGISLREAVKYSPPGATVTFAPALANQTIRLTLGEILISQSLTIDGSVLRGRITLSGDKIGNGKSSDDTRIINIASGTVLLDSLNLDRGCCTTGSAGYGAAIYVNNTLTNLTLRNSTLSNNESTTYGGGIYFIGAFNNANSFLAIQNCILTGNTTGHNGGAIHMFGTLRVEDSVFSHNTADQGCAIFTDAGMATVETSIFTDNVASGYGGAICNESTFTLRSSTLSKNSAPRGGGICSFSGALTVETTTLFENSASIYGGGIYIASGTAAIRNSTLAGNFSGDDGGGIYSAKGNLSLLHATVTKNSALSSRGGIFGTDSGSLSLVKSIVAANTAPFVPDFSISYTGANNLTSGNPLLAPLGDYGGPTHTMPPLLGSAAINAGGTIALITDQRGFSRDPKPDIGAVEYKGTSDLTRFWNLDFDGDGFAYGAEQALGTDFFVADVADPRHLTVLALNVSGHPVLTFGIGAAAPGTHWILRRSTDLLTFTEIYRYSGSTDTAVPGVTFLRTSKRITVTDTNPPTGGVFYRFEARLEP